MKRKTRKELCAAAWLIFAFALWTAAVRCIDVQGIGPLGSAVGFAAANRFFHRLTGIHMALYTITDWLGLVPVGIALGFALFGLGQWVRRKKLRLVDRSILALGGFYIAVMAAYVFFEVMIINHRPVLISGCLEASYPSSTTLLAMCVMPTAAMQFNARIRNGTLRRCAAWAIAAFTAFMVTGRLVSGVHWLSDIIGGALLSAGLVFLYRAAAGSDGGHSRK